MGVSTLTPRVEQLERVTVEQNGRLDCQDKVLDQHAKTIDRHEITLYGMDNGLGLVKTVEDMTKIMDAILISQAKQQVFNGILTFIGAALGASVIAFIWSVITHAVTIVK
jgi:hypothetical protein